MKKRSVKIYVYPSSWSAYVVSEDAFSKITVPVTPESMDPEIYAQGWEQYRDDWVENGAEVSVIYREKERIAA